LPAAPSGDHGAPAVEDIAKTALNGAQVTSLIDVIQSASSAMIPKESVKPIIAAAFPTLDAATINAIVEPLSGFTAAGTDGTPARAAGEYEDKTRLQWKRNVKAIRDVLNDVGAKTMTPAMATTMLQSLGLSDEKAQSLLADVSDDGKLGDSSEQELAAAESFAKKVDRVSAAVYEGLSFYP
jgi:hypothetical protein